MDEETDPERVVTRLTGLVWGQLGELEPEGIEEEGRRDGRLGIFLSIQWSGPQIWESPWIVPLPSLP